MPFSLILGEKPAAFYTKTVHLVLGKMIPVKIKIEGLENFDQNRSYVLVANHRSNLDSVALYNIPHAEYRWAIKKEILKIPILGFFAKRMGNIAIDRKNPQKARFAIEKAVKSISGGINIVFFPEGTRNKEAGLLPFKKGAFHFAIDTSLPILPVTIFNSDKILPKYSLNFKYGTIFLKIHPPIETTGLSKERISDLVEKSQEIIFKSYKDFQKRLNVVSK